MNAVDSPSVLSELYPLVADSAKRLPRRWFRRNRAHVLGDVVGQAWQLILEDDLRSRRPGSTLRAYAFGMTLKAAAQVADRKHARLAARLRVRPPLRPPPQPPRQTVEQLQTAEEVARALDALSATLRTPVKMRFFDGLTCTEIATACGLSNAVVHLRLHRATKKLRASLLRLRD